MHNYIDNGQEISDIEVESYFNKVFTFKKLNKARLPKSTSIFSEAAYKVPNLQKYKAELNFVKSKLNDYDICDWHQHTRKRSPG
jgi:cap2 methyltransferase